METSRKDSSVLIPGGGALESRGFGGGGGEGQGDDDDDDDDDDDVEDVDEGVDGDEPDEVGEGGGVKGPVAPGTIAAFLSSSIFSRCFSFSSAILFTPSFCAF